MKIKNKSENISKSRRNFKFLSKINSSNFGLKKMFFYKNSNSKKQNKLKKTKKKRDKNLNQEKGKYGKKKNVNFRYQKNGLFPYITKPKQMKNCVYSYK